MRPIVRRIVLSAFLAALGPGFACAQEPAAQSERADFAFWESIRDSGDASEFEAYLKAFPQGRFAPLATIRLSRLRDGVAGHKPVEQAPVRTQVREHALAAVPDAPPAKTRGWIGAEIRSIDAKRAKEIGLAAASGAEIVAVSGFGPASKGDLKPGDAFVSVGDVAVIDADHFVRLTSALQPGQTAKFVIVRGRERRTVTLMVGKFFEDQWKAAHRGDPVAMRQIGIIYSSGVLVALDHEQANAWFRKAADAGDVWAMNALAKQYRFGRGVVRSDVEAFRWFRKAADTGDVYGSFAVGLLYQQGKGVERNVGQAARWYRLAIEKGSAAAMQNYGTMLQRGDGVRKDEALALEYFRRGAKGGQLESFASIASAYYSGIGVGKDLKQAAYWFRESANRGVHWGFAGLGKMIERGEGGLRKDRAQAVANYRKAAEQGNDFALKRLKALKTSIYDPREVQQLLSDLGFDPGRIDGRLRDQTRTAISAFQGSRGIASNGEASLSLVGQLREAVKQKAAAGPTTVQSAVAPNSDKPSPKLGGLSDLEKLDELQ
ncbi:MAG: peptidoglycan-binding protein [Pseudomonadota bacterium]